MESKILFEQIKQTNKIGQEFWSARELSEALGYAQWRNFLKVIEAAKEACKNSSQKPTDHFVEVSKMVELGSGSQREIDDFQLTRYACYLIVQNADPSKEIVALGQTYFALQTRKQEIQDQKFEELKDENEKRIFLRKEMAEHNKKLADAAKEAGVIQPWEYAVFQNHGYMGLYNGLDAKEIQTKRV